jgi:hypothetical protein
VNQGLSAEEIIADNQDRLVEAWALEELLGPNWLTRPSRNEVPPVSD